MIVPCRELQSLLRDLNVFRLILTISPTSTQSPLHKYKPLGSTLTYIETWNQNICLEARITSQGGESKEATQQSDANSKGKTGTKGNA